MLVIQSTSGKQFYGCRENEIPFGKYPRRCRSHGVIDGIHATNGHKYHSMLLLLTNSDENIVSTQKNNFWLCSMSTHSIRTYGRVEIQFLNPNVAAFSTAYDRTTVLHIWLLISFYSPTFRFWRHSYSILTFYISHLIHSFTMVAYIAFCAHVFELNPCRCMKII